MNLKKNEVVVEIPGETKYIRKISDNIIASLKGYSLSDAELFSIRLCIEEALRNAIKHGNKSNKELPVKVTYCSDAGILEISVEDSGEGFDYKNLPDPTTEENIMRERGRGIFLIRRLMDEVSFNEKGNKIKMTKKLR